MNFEEALKLLKAGKKVKKCSWANSQKLYLYLENNEFWLATGEIAGTIGIHYDDMLADDYEEPTLLIIDRINANEYRFKLQTIIEMAKKEELINRN